MRPARVLRLPEDVCWQRYRPGFDDKTMDAIITTSTRRLGERDRKPAPKVKHEPQDKA